MRLLRLRSGFLAVQKHYGPRGLVHVSGYGETRLLAMGACRDLFNLLNKETKS